MWRVENHLATFHRPELAWQLALDHPELGIGELIVAGRPLAGTRLLEVRPSPGPLPERVADYYVRENDLVVTYEQTPPRTVRPQLYWRYVCCELPGNQRVHGAEVVISVQTDLLDSQPQTLVRSCLAAGPAAPQHRGGAGLLDEPACWVLRGGGMEKCGLEQGEQVELSRESARPLVAVPVMAEWSYVELAYPSDFTRAMVTYEPEANGESAGVRIRWSLFDEHLEKGVIRRARLRGLFVPSRLVLDMARPLLDQFAGSELPLTT